MGAIHDRATPGNLQPEHPPQINVPWSQLSPLVR